MKSWMTSFEMLEDELAQLNQQHEEVIEKLNIAYTQRS